MSRKRDGTNFIYEFVARRFILKIKIIKLII